jgi:N-acetylglucosamine kinase-like BadF-type ATPase
LTGQVLSRLGLADVPDLVPVIYAYKDKKDIAAFAELLGPALAAGDEAAAEIAEAAAQSLTELGAAAARKLGFAGGFEITTGGGVLTNNTYIYIRFAEMMAEALPEARLIKPKSPPSYGAALMAKEENRKRR